jgi:hypothetical protein
MQSFNILACTRIFKRFKKVLASWKFIQSIMVKITEWSSFLGSATLKDSKKI